MTVLVELVGILLGVTNLVLWATLASWGMEDW